MPFEYRQGFFHPIYEDKLISNKAIIYRSSWERRLMDFLDKNPAVKKYGSETFSIPYFDLGTQKHRTYITDFVALIENKDGIQKKYIIEVKPQKQVPKYDEKGDIIFPPKPKINNKKAIAAWQEKCVTLLTNHSKFTTAKQWAKQLNAEFIIITEKELF